MTTFLLVRHGLTDAVGKLLAGGAPGWRLNPEGRLQAETLARRLKRLPIRAVYSSPLERAVETAESLSVQIGITPVLLDDLRDFHFGAWEGLTFSQLEKEPEWRRFNTVRSLVRPPGGELMMEVQTRVVRQLHCLAHKHPNEMVVAVSHADPVRSALAYYLAMPLDSLLRFEIDPASVSVVELGQGSPRVLCMNETGDIPL